MFYWTLPEITTQVSSDETPTRTHIGKRNRRTIHQNRRRPQILFDDNRTEHPHERSLLAYVTHRKTDPVTGGRSQSGATLGHPIERIRCDNANEYLTKTLATVFGQRAVALDPTTPHTPQENAVSERLNRTLVSRLRATLHAAHIPFSKYWSFCILHAIGKKNSIWQRTIQDIPRRLWERYGKPYSPYPKRKLRLDTYRMFGEYTFIPKLQNIKKKPQPRIKLVRYLYTVDERHYKVIVPETGQLLTTRIAKFRPYNPNFDPMYWYPHPIPTHETQQPLVNLHHVQPRDASQANTSPQPIAPNNARPVIKTKPPPSSLRPD